MNYSPANIAKADILQHNVSLQINGKDTER